jgi:hypothetical protein
VLFLLAVEAAGTGAANHGCLRCHDDLSLRRV